MTDDEINVDVPDEPFAASKTATVTIEVPGWAFVPLWALISEGTRSALTLAEHDNELISSSFKAVALLGEKVREPLQDEVGDSKADAIERWSGRFRLETENFDDIDVDVEWSDE